jgi:uncharacterized protein (TIGR02271 family)
MERRLNTESIVERSGEGAGAGEAAARDTQETTIPVIAEELDVSARPVKTGSVQVHKKVQEHVERIDIPVVEETVDIRRVVMNREVSAAPPVRTEDGVIIVPVVHEELVVTKRLILKEEIHLIRKRATTRATRDVTVRREEAQVERADAQDRPIRTERSPERSADGSAALLRPSPSLIKGRRKTR